MKFEFPEARAHADSGRKAASAASDERLYLEYVLESIKRVQNYAGGYYQALAVNQMAQDAIVWRLRVLADWANTVPDAEKRRFSGIPWAEISEFSGLTGHPWDHVNLHRVWLLAKDHLEPLKRIIQGQLKKLR